MVKYKYMGEFKIKAEESNGGSMGVNQRLPESPQVETRGFKMLFVSRIKNSIIVASPFLLHLFMVVAVGVYTVAGAYVMRYLENKEINRLNIQNGHNSEAKSKRDISDVIVTGSELALIAQSVHPCLEKAMESIKSLTQCNASDLEKISITSIDDCYRNAKISINHTEVYRAGYANDQPESFELTTQTSQNTWDFPNSLIFAFTVITTIVFGLLGIPMALLTIADIGMFLNRLVKKVVQLYGQSKSLIINYIEKWGRKPSQDAECIEEDKSAASPNENTPSVEKPKDEHERSGKESLTLGLIFYYTCLSAQL
uniref:Uncharacterized protein n=1 Tax=Ditylenchus dipsaci TaxID=166011 RepID=A0A915DLN4_9BILA